MLIYFAADHRGFQLKEQLKSKVKDIGYEVVDSGAEKHDETDDYPDFAGKASKEISQDPDLRRGIFICGSGAGVDIVANKFPRVRSVLGLSPDQVFASRRDDNVNVLSIASDFTEIDTAEIMLTVFLETPFSQEERHKRRIEKITELER